MTTTTLMAWAVPAFFSGAPVDHTWVTSYDNRLTPYPTVQDVVTAGAEYWFCWGSFHWQGGTSQIPDGFLGSQAGDLPTAICLVAPNLDSRSNPAAQGTIFHYGVDGVCHQLANQVLYSTGVGGAAPMTVSNARGYSVSTFLYGTYGLQQAAWAAKIAACVGWGGGGGGFTERLTMDQQQDEFELHLRKTLGSQDQKLADELIAFRTASHAERVASRDKPASPKEINLANQRLLNKAAELLGHDKFVQVFGHTPDQPIELVRAQTLPAD